jgi:hypothetical protein
MPVAGSQPSFRENRMTSISASQKPGTETPSRATTMQSRSAKRFWLTAARMPRGIPISMEKTMVESPRSSVRGMRASSSWVMGMWVK